MNAIHRIEPSTGSKPETRQLPEGVSMSGMEADGRGRIVCAAGAAGTIDLVSVAEE